MATASRNSNQVADTDPGTGDDGLASTYDDEMLNSHFITGDGRGNENIALTTVHSIFHSEHDRVVDVNKHTILDSGDLAFINEWLRVDIADLAEIATQEQKDALIANQTAWDGERLFQAARFTTEMQYQHLVFEEFARAHPADGRSVRVQQQPRSRSGDRGGVCPHGLPFRPLDADRHG